MGGTAESSFHQAILVGHIADDSAVLNEKEEFKDSVQINSPFNNKWTKHQNRTMRDINHLDNSSSQKKIHQCHHSVHLKTKRSPVCALCDNHGLIVSVKNHKRYCPRRCCPCFKCKLTRYRRKKGASQVAERRAKAQDREMAKNLMAQSIGSNLGTITDINSKIFQTIYTRRRSDTPEQTDEKMQYSSTDNLSAWENVSPRTEISSITHNQFWNMYPTTGGQPTTKIGYMKESVKNLMEMFQLPPQTDFILYWILASYGGDFMLAVSNIYDAQIEFRKLTLLQQAAQRPCAASNVFSLAQKDFAAENSNQS